MLNELISKTTLTLSSTTLSTSWASVLTGEQVAFMLLLCFVGLLNLEARFPNIIRSAKQTRQSYQTNICIFIFNSILMSVCSISSLYVVAEQYSNYGLLNYLYNPTLKAILSFLVLDLMLYGWHQLCHRVDAFWQFHRVHHNDSSLNVSTAFRLHCIEIFVTNILKVLLIITLGIDQMLVLIIETFTTLCIMFHHTNTGFKFEHTLGYVMIVPFLHRCHHSTERREHDRNYGAVLSVWDRLFGTLSEAKPEFIGIKGSSPQSLINLIKFGFGLEAPVTVRYTHLDDMIAEAAYYKAEKRNFYPGYELRDWLEAKQDITRLYGNALYPEHIDWQGRVDYFRSQLSNFCQMFRQFSLKDIVQMNDHNWVRLNKRH